jgi:hypothetical protein
MTTKRLAFQVGKCHQFDVGLAGDIKAKESIKLYTIAKARVAYNAGLSYLL